VPADLIAKLKAIAAGRAAGEPLLRRPGGDAWRPEVADISRRFADAMAAAGLPKGITPYALRHSCATRMILAGLPLRVIADQLDTSTTELERAYSHLISDHSDALVRAAQIEIGKPATDKVVSLAGRRP